MPVSHKEIEEITKKQKEAFVRDYKKIVEIPSVSAISAHKKDCEDTAWVASEFFREAGAEVTVFATKGNPVVFAHFENKPGAPTIAIYNHLDVQPATEGKDGWTRPPFTFTEEDGRFYARGTTDDKGPAMTALWAAKIARELKIPINIEFIWELEEESGSAHFADFVDMAKHEIKAQSVLVSDTIWLSATKPSIPLGLRGVVTAFIRLKTGTKDVHSGLAGGAARNPLVELAQVITECVDAKTGNIKIPGMEKTWVPPTKERVDGFVNSGFSIQNFKNVYGLEKLRFDDPREVTTRIWASPTFEVHGFRGGYQDEGMKTVVPQWAEAKVSMRLAPGQNWKDAFSLFEQHVKKINPDCEVIRDGVHEPYTSSGDTPQVRAVSEALEYAFGATPALTSEGGSIGAILTMNKKLNVPVAMLGLSLPEDGYHGPNESFAWKQIEGGVKAFIRYFEIVASQK